VIINVYGSNIYFYKYFVYMYGRNRRRLARKSIILFYLFVISSHKPRNLRKVQKSRNLSLKFIRNPPPSNSFFSQIKISTLGLRKEISFPAKLIRPSKYLLINKAN